MLPQGIISLSVHQLKDSSTDTKRLFTLSNLYPVLIQVIAMRYTRLLWYKKRVLISEASRTTIATSGGSFSQIITHKNKLDSPVNKSQHSFDIKFIQHKYYLQLQHHKHCQSSGVGPLFQAGSPS